MSMISDGKAVIPSVLENARGGTELMRDRLVSWLSTSSDLMQGVDIHVGRVYSTKKAYRKKVVWIHDLPRDLPIDAISDADAIVFVSHWQRDIFIGHVPSLWDRSFVIPNAFDFTHTKVTDHMRITDERFKVVYHTTPHRGLDIALNAFKRFHKKVPNSCFDVYSSFKVYGMPHQDEPFKALFKALDDTPGVTRHDTLPNHEMIPRLADYDCFLYPSIWHETSCLAMMEALAAGLVCVHSNLGALPETTRGLGFSFDFRTNRQEMADRAYEQLTKAYRFVTNRRQDGFTSWEQSHVFRRIHGGPARFKASWIDLLTRLKG